MGDLEAEREMDVEMNEKIFLGKDKDSDVCLGGVILTCNEGRTICKNTLDVRIE